MAGPEIGEPIVLCEQGIKRLPELTVDLAWHGPEAYLVPSAEGKPVGG